MDDCPTTSSEAGEGRCECAEEGRWAYSMTTEGVSDCEVGQRGRRVLWCKRLKREHECLRKEKVHVHTVREEDLIAPGLRAREGKGKGTGRRSRGGEVGESRRARGVGNDERRVGAAAPLQNLTHPAPSGTPWRPLTRPLLPLKHSGAPETRPGNNVDSTLELVNFGSKS